MWRRHARHFSQVSAARAIRINELLDQSTALITALDLTEANCDLEGADDEQSLGWDIAAGNPFCPASRPIRLTAHLHGLELDNCDHENGHDAEPCPDFYGETVTWENDPHSQEMLVRV
ncbi:hypothetical protein EOD23_06565 [Mesorhizobium sp. USDA-HM6]|nr:hypothetical protein EOD23_06565 [Mesorhizobium sp. USDA-HM6]